MQYVPGATSLKTKAPSASVTVSAWPLEGQAPTPSRTVIPAMPSSPTSMTPLPYRAPKESDMQAGVGLVDDAVGSQVSLHTDPIK